MGSEMCIRDSGQPLRVGYYDAAATEDEREILARAVIDLATDAGVTIPKGMEIEFKAALGGDTQAFERMINVIDRYYSLIFSGGELTNLAGEKGARNLGVVHERRANYRVDFWGADMAEAISEGFCKPLVKWNFGERPGYPKYIFEASRIDELCTRWGIDKEAIDRNIPIPSTYFYRTYGWPVPEPGEGVIVPPAGKRPDSPTSPVTALSRGGFDGPVDPDFAMIDAYAERGAAEVVGQYTDLITRLTTAAEQIDTNGDDAELAARLQTTVGAKPQQAFRETLAAHLRDYLVAGLAAGVAATAADAQREGVGKKVDRGAMVDETFAALQAAAGVTTLSRGALLTNAAYAAHIAEFGRRPKLTLLQHVAIGDQGGGSEEDWHAVAPQRAIEFWAKRAGVTASRFAQMDSAARAYALHVAGIEDQAVIDAVVTGIRRSLETGATARDFARSIREACAAAGVDPLDPHRIQFIYHQNMMTAYGAARAASQHSAAVTKYLKYIELVTMGDSRVRPEHQRLNHLTLPADDPRWSELTPPLDYGCRCRTVSRLEPRAGAPTEAPMMPSRSAGFGGDGPVNTWRQFVAGGGR